MILISLHSLWFPFTLTLMILLLNVVNFYQMVQAVDTVEASRLIGEARKRKGLGKLKPPVIRFRLVGSIDQAPWEAEAKRRVKSGSTLELDEMELELSKWEAIIQDPTFQPFINVVTADAKWKVILGNICFTG